MTKLKIEHHKLANPYFIKYFADKNITMYASNRVKHANPSAFFSSLLVDTEAFFSRLLVESEAFLTNSLVQTEAFFPRLLVENEAFFTSLLVETEKFASRLLTIMTTRVCSTTV